MMEDIYNYLISPQDALDSVRTQLNEGDYSEYSEDELKALEALIIDYIKEGEN